MVKLHMKQRPSVWYNTGHFLGLTTFWSSHISCFLCDFGFFCIGITYLGYRLNYEIIWQYWSPTTSNVYVCATFDLFLHQQITFDNRKDKISRSLTFSNWITPNTPKSLSLSIYARALPNCYIKRPMADVQWCITAPRPLPTRGLCQYSTS